MGDDQLDQVKRLFALCQEGFLTEAEFESEKRRLLGLPHVAPTASDVGVEAPLELDALAPFQNATASDSTSEEEGYVRGGFDPSDGMSVQRYFFLAVLTLFVGIPIALFIVSRPTGGATSGTDSRITPQAEIVQPAPMNSNAGLKEWLVGSWAYGDSCFTDAGIEYFENGRWETMYEKGTWTLDNATLTEVTTATREPPGDPWHQLDRPKTLHQTIVRKGTSSLEYRDARGKRLVAVRCKANTEPATQPSTIVQASGEVAQLESCMGKFLAASPTVTPDGEEFPDLGRTAGEVIEVIGAWQNEESGERAYCALRGPCFPAPNIQLTGNCRSVVLEYVTDAGDVVRSKPLTS